MFTPSLQFRGKRYVVVIMGALKCVLYRYSVLFCAVHRASCML
jgi:hypothetical protein